MRLILIAVLGCYFVYAGSSHSQDQKGIMKGKKNFLDGYNAQNKDGTVNAVIEIPAGSTEKWEVSKPEGYLKWEKLEHGYRKVEYLGYPANYGMIPQTLLPKSLGGDGDPLDIIVLGDSLERGEIVKVQLIGVLILKDRGEQDDKIIAVPTKGVFSEVKDIEELDSKFSGITEILKTWFVNYKGRGKLSSIGFKRADHAKKVLEESIAAYKKSKN